MRRGRGGIFRLIGSIWQGMSRDRTSNDKDMDKKLVFPYIEVAGGSKVQLA